ncbi:MAG: thioredoxin family protein [Maritimibacter sp.]
MRNHLKSLVVAGIMSLFALPALAAELIMVEQPGCAYCRQWDREIAPIYPKTEEAALAPLRRVQLKDIKRSGLAIARPVNFTPTFLLVDESGELARLEGYPGEDFFWGLLAMMLEAHLGFERDHGG